MKNLKWAALALALCVSTFVSAQDEQVYEFTVVKEIDATETKDQCRTGTCWSFATISFLESEALRLGNGKHDFSEMFNVRVTYPLKAEKYVRYQGKYQFGPGSLSHDVINAVAEHGIVPESVYKGLNYGLEEHNHAEMDAMLEAMVKAVVENKGRRLTNKWEDAVNSVLDVYLGEIPTTFEYSGKIYTPEEFRNAMGIVPEDYLSFTSFTHHPFYEPFVLEVPDNFSQEPFNNVPLEDLVSIVDNAIEKGFTVAWDADVSERGFSFRNGMAIAPEESVSKDQLFKEVVEEVEVTQMLRQVQFNNFQTTDDHLMHIVGMALDQDGKEYYIVKNSWGADNPYGGIQYVSKAYFMLKTVGILVHQDAVPSDVSKEFKR
ncbi:C1 family peptidase [Halocola ammonii]